MPAYSWPASLPDRLLVSGYSEGESDGLIRSQPDTGPAKIRRRSSGMPRPLSGAMRLTGAQVVVARTFHREVLMNGALPFHFFDPITREDILVRFAGPPSWSCVGGDNYDFMMPLEVLP